MLEELYKGNDEHEKIMHYKSHVILTRQHHLSSLSPTLGRLATMDVLSPIYVTFAFHMGQR